MWPSRSSPTCFEFLDSEFSMLKYFYSSITFKFLTYKSHGLKRKVSELCASVKFKKIANKIMNNFRILDQY